MSEWQKQTKVQLILPQLNISSVLKIEQGTFLFCMNSRNKIEVQLILIQINISSVPILEQETHNRQMHTALSFYKKLYEHRYLVSNNVKQ